MRKGYSAEKKDDLQAQPPTGFPIHLGPRLAAASELVMAYLAGEAGEGIVSRRILADIGSDHAYLPAYLLQRDVISRAIAVDVHEGPYQNILRTIELYSLEGRLEARRGDGLAVLRPGEADVIVMAGMGGATMVKILRDGAAVADQARCLVLQPQNAYETLCRMLLDIGWRLAEEALAEEGQEIYRLMMWRQHGSCQQQGPCQHAQGQDKSVQSRDIAAQAWDMAVIEENMAFWREQACPESDAEIFAQCVWALGPMNIARRDRLLLSLGRRELARMARASAGLSLSGSEESESKRRSVAAAIRIGEDVLKWLFP